MSLNRRVRVGIGAVFGILLTLLLPLLSVNTATAAQITNRSLTLQAGGTDGGSKPGGVVNHFFSFEVGTTASVGSIQFEYCTLAVGTCTTPTGLDTTSATMGTQAGATGFTLVNTTNGAPYITRTAASITATTPVNYQLVTITNPTAANLTFFVRISTFAATNATGSAIDTGNVAATTATQVILSGTMPESLIFCAGGTVSTTSGVPDCSTATSGAVTFNQLFSPTSTATTTSQMAASTNAGTGYVITVNGATMTSGSNTVTSMSTATTSVFGTGQFGMNLMANTTASSSPAVGTAIAPAANGTDLKGQAITGYNTVDTFKFTSGDSVANSAVSGAGPTNAQIYTASYIVNVPGSQPAGTYTTTLTYICTPTF
jgi:trimeric autotransporter adhesin